MDWFRWWHGTVTDPKFQVVARRSGVRVGDVLAFWAVLLEQASAVTQCNATKHRGDVADVDFEASDVLLGFEDGVSERIFGALVEKSLVVDGMVANWDKRQPKREDPSAERVRRHRETKKGASAQGDETPVKRDVTQCNAPDTETDRETEESKPSGANAPVDAGSAGAGSPGKIPACPHQKILALYAELLPTLPQPNPALWDGVRAKNLAARWKWVMSLPGKEDRARTAEDGLRYFARLFRYIGESDFLMNRGEGRWDGCNLGWIVKAENFKKIVEGNYENKAPQ